MSGRLSRPQEVRLKKSVTEKPFLALSDTKKAYKVQMDACDFAIGCIMLQGGIAFESRKLKEVEMNVVHCLRA